MPHPLVTFFDERSQIALWQPRPHSQFNTVDNLDPVLLTNHDARMPLPTPFAQHAYHAKMAI